MSDSTPPPSHLALSLGRMPTGLYLVTTKTPDGPVGFIGSFVMQMGFKPPTLCVGVGKERGPLAAMRAHGSFAVSILDAKSQGLMGAFFKKYEDGSGPFDQVEHKAAPSGAPIITGALAWMDCSISGEHELDDHVVVFGTVEAGELLREGDPSIHLRKNGLSY
ncbi:MAG: flavin reductase (DIM6/NTAB) family NADH-FMN oxidoreductase RutF [Planctomycetota bacterium]|jgi:flavin reductase (DIM6/NTAB) family NADH-FMN oxidoreductase RutF